MTVREAAIKWDIPLNTLRGMMRIGKVKYSKENGSICIPEQAKPEYKGHNAALKKSLGRDAYNRWYIKKYGEEKTIGSICKYLNISRKEVCDIYDEIVADKDGAVECAILQSMLTDLCVDVYRDAAEHQLWNEEMPLECALRIGDEVRELAEAAGDDAAYAEELADVILMALSTAGHLGIDIAEAMIQKMKINKNRPLKHKEDDHGNDAT